MFRKSIAQVAFILSSIIWVAPTVAQSSGEELQKPYCFIALNTTGDGVITFGPQSSFSGDCIVGSNSTSAKSVELKSGSQINADVQSVGGISIGPNAVITGMTSANAFAVPDPFESKTDPAITVQCDYQNYVASGSETLNPGIYCGGITIRGNQSVTLSPGQYYLLDGDFTVRGPANVNGAGVFLAFLGSSSSSVGNLSFAGNGNVSLSAETSGDYANILVYQSKLANTSIGGKTLENELGGGSVSLEGAVYTANRRLVLSGDITANCPAFVANEVHQSSGTSVNATFTNCPSSDGGGIIIR